MARIFFYGRRDESVEVVLILGGELLLLDSRDDDGVWDGFVRVDD